MSSKNKFTEATFIKGVIDLLMLFTLSLSIITLAIHLVNFILGISFGNIIVFLSIGYLMLNGG